MAKSVARTSGGAGRLPNPGNFLRSRVHGSWPIPRNVTGRVLGRVSEPRRGLVLALPTRIPGPAFGALLGTRRREFDARMRAARRSKTVPKWIKIVTEISLLGATKIDRPTNREIGTDSDPKPGEFGSHIRPKNGQDGIGIMFVACRLLPSRRTFSSRFRYTNASLSDTETRSYLCRNCAGFSVEIDTLEVRIVAPSGTRVPFADGAWSAAAQVLFTGGDSCGYLRTKRSSESPESTRRSGCSAARKALGIGGWQRRSSIETLAFSRTSFGSHRVPADGEPIGRLLSGNSPGYGGGISTRSVADLLFDGANEWTLISDQNIVVGNGPNSPRGAQNPSHPLRVVGAFRGPRVCIPERHHGDAAPRGLKLRANSIAGSATRSVGLSK